MWQHLLLVSQEPLERHYIVEGLCIDQITQQSMQVTVVRRLRKSKLSAVLVKQKELSYTCKKSIRGLDGTKIVLKNLQGISLVIRSSGLV